MKNRLSDLHNHLFMQLERLNDENIQGDNLVAEIERARAVSAIASQIIANGSLVLKARLAMDNSLFRDDYPKMLIGESEYKKA